jgi:hypothetical protein
MSISSATAAATQYENESEADVLSWEEGRDRDFNKLVDDIVRECPFATRCPTLMYMHLLYRAPYWAREFWRDQREENEKLAEAFMEMASDEDIRQYGLAVNAACQSRTLKKQDPAE